MNLAPLAQILTAHAQTADNNTALALSDTHETISHDRFNRINHLLRLTSVLTSLVLRLHLVRGSLILVLGPTPAPVLIPTMHLRAGSLTGLGRMTPSWKNSPRN